MTMLFCIAESEIKVIHIYTVSEEEEVSWNVRECPEMAHDI